MTKIRAIIALGANRPSSVGEPPRTLDEALRRLASRQDVDVTARSGYHATAPVGGPADQPAYTNAAALLETSLGAQELLAVLQGIEADLGRNREKEVRFGPRTCDLDLLFYGDEVIDDPPTLILPHPRLHQRRFVLVPLAEIAPEWRHPVLGRTVAELLGQLSQEDQA